MLKDRPAMAQYGDEAGVLYPWAVRVRGRKSGAANFLGPRRTIGNEGRAFLADRGIAGPYQGPREVCGRAQCGQGASWGGNVGRAVYELYNILNVKDFRRCNDDAAAGKLSKEEFVVRTAEVENRAGEKEWAFYLRVFLPWAKEHPSPPTRSSGTSAHICIPRKRMPAVDRGRRALSAAHRTTV